LLSYSKRKYSNRGFTIPEVLVSAVTFLIISILVASSLLLGIRYLRTAETRIADQLVCRGAVDIIITDMRLGVPNLDPGDMKPPTGYYRIKPPINTTAILIPNENEESITSSYIEFTKPNYEAISNSETGFDNMLPEMFIIVKYYCTDSFLYREVSRIDEDGTINPPVRTVIAEVENGILELTAKNIDYRMTEVNLAIRKVENDEIKTTCSYRAIGTVAVE
jgi:type II secretory pathway pseudopilin PulG